MCLCCSWKKEISWLETINQIGRGTERKAGEPTELDEREPDVSVARKGIPRERQPAASWPGQRGTPGRLHSATKALPSKSFSVLGYRALVKHFFTTPVLIANVNLLYLPGFDKLKKKKKRFFFISCIYL